MIKLFPVLLLLVSQAAAEFAPFGQQAAREDAPPLNFCAQGKFLIYAGDCVPGAKEKDVISRKACGDVVSVLGEALPLLYPNATVEPYSGLTADEVLESLMRPNVLGFFFVGQGDAKGGFITGPEREKVYPDFSACLSAYDVFGGFTSHSKYSPASPAPKTARGRVLSRTEVLYDAAGAAPDSWVKFCKPRLGLVYPTRTFAGRMKGDVMKLIGLLQEEKKKHILKTLATICDNCAGHVAAGDELARLCPPNSDVCKLRKITPGSERLVLENYCLALAPAPSR
ncbi:MAG: hypothetical protein A2X35_05030 [Elusimicrobia bacterium GWA2_61_42]|nr:MAG: hypothetical protein A2X35_05030 [Elusimicrobia bacterium GWA2_61_42]OGR77874.1 MAG: hypothetical protein A2X38_00495 [Elusimicrobia bacterium GWC2_61_25]